MIRKSIAAVCAVAAICAACFKEVPVVPTSVAYKVMPESGGTGYVAFDSTGKIRGGHMSGGPAPVVREDSGSISAAQAAGIFADVTALGDTLLRRAPVNIAEPAGSRQIAVLFSDASQARIVWPLDREHPDPRVNALAAKLAALRTPAW